MDSPGGFYEEEKDGKLIQFYHHPKYHPIPISSGETASPDDLLSPLFLCPLERFKHDSTGDLYRCNSSAEYVPSTTPGHHVLPLFWCNNIEFKEDAECHMCYGSYFYEDYYYCEVHDSKFHKKCVESPLLLKHPYHPEHFLQLSFITFESRLQKSLCCEKEARGFGYHCAICDAFLHIVCAMKSVCFVIDQPKRHDHPLTLFPKQAFLICNVCGLVRNSLTYVCLRCTFVSHNDCMNSPKVIKISRHDHRISYTSSLQSEKWSCGVCRQSINSNYGAYTCGTCGDYAVHPRCALRKDLMDGKELEGLLEEDDTTEEDGSFEIISEGLILHFLHDHHLRLEFNIFYDENKTCQACYLPVYEGNFYICIECDFIIHEACAGARRRIQHALHPHPLTLKVASRYVNEIYCCNACGRKCNTFVYECRKGQCTFDLDLRCASVSEPFDFKGHEHPLFLALAPEETPICEVCKLECEKQLNCIECNFIVCMKCATLPYKARYQHDTHFLTLKFGKEVYEEYWCEACERNLGDTNTKMFYRCNECCTTLHVDCLIGKDPYIKPGPLINEGRDIQIVLKEKLSWSFCDVCKNLCHKIIFKTDDRMICSMECLVRTYF